VERPGPARPLPAERAIAPAAHRLRPDSHFEIDFARVGCGGTLNTGFSTDSLWGEIFSHIEKHPRVRDLGYFCWWPNALVFCLTLLFGAYCVLVGNGTGKVFVP
jgi:hypothetical protein